MYNIRRSLSILYLPTVTREERGDNCWKKGEKLYGRIMKKKKVVVFVQRAETRTTQESSWFSTASAFDFPQYSKYLRILTSTLHICLPLPLHYPISYARNTRPSSSIYSGTYSMYPTISCCGERLKIGTSKPYSSVFKLYAHTIT